MFLKPTVVTLAFGLGFGVVLVLLVTPAVLGVEHDIRMALKSLRHALRLRHRGEREAARVGRYIAPKRKPAPRRPVTTSGETAPEPTPEAARSAAE